MGIEIKICGLSTREAVETCAALGADLAGFIFFPRSPRNVTPQQAAGLGGFVRDMRKVAVTVNADDGFLDTIIEHLSPDLLQLHGVETPQRVGEVKRRYGLPVIKAFAIRERGDVALLRDYDGFADRLLLDAKAPEGSYLPGGNGVSFDWTLLAGLQTDVPWMLSGGLNAENIREALAVSGAVAIDVSSGVESSPGVKDIAKIAAFIKTVREMPGA